MKLNVTDRLIGLTLAEDILSNKNKVILPKGHLVKAKDKDLLDKHYYEGTFKTTDMGVEESFIETQASYAGITMEEAKRLTDVVIVKAFLTLPTGEKELVHVVGNVHNELLTLTLSDIFAAFSHMLNLEQGLLEYDDIDSLANRKVRSIYELLRNQFRIGMTRIEKNLRDRTSAKDTTMVTIRNATNHKLMESAMKEFFNSSQLSQFMDQINPLAEVSNKRRITSLGPGGISRETASLVVRGIHDTHYGRIDPIETPEGPNIGLILNLAYYSRINQYGLLETPYFVVEDAVVNRNKIK